MGFGDFLINFRIVPRAFEFSVLKEGSAALNRGLLIQPHLRNQRVRTVGKIQLKVLSMFEQ